MDTRFWGPSGWRLLHLILETPLEERNEKQIKTLFETLPYILPCKFCRNSLSTYYEKHPIPEDYTDMSHWLYVIHNEVNNKLRSQGLATEDNPKYEDIKKRYKEWTSMPCSSTQMLGWDFLFSIANTTPTKASHSSPMANAPTTLDTVELKNRWNTMTYKERLPYVQKWWQTIGQVLPFKPWRKAWSTAIRKEGQAPLNKGRRATLNWLFRMEQFICKTMAEQAPHNSFYGLCKEVSAFSSGCGKKTSPRVKTCRAKKEKARETLRRLRNSNVQ